MRLNGLDFNVEIDGYGPPLLLLHGFTGSVQAWGEVRPALSRSARCIWIDAIGHGRSAAPADARRYSLDCSSLDLAALLDALDLQTASVLGYSMGGRAALHFAVQSPDRVSRLILESASPGLEDETDRAVRLASDDALAERLVKDGLEAFVAEWERQPLLQLAPHVAEATRARQHALRLQNSPDGLANSLRGMGTGRQGPLWSNLRQIESAVTVIVGQNDLRYCQIGERMCQLLPDGSLHVVSAAGHSVHLDQPARFVELVRTALDGGA